MVFVPLLSECQPPSQRSVTHHPDTNNPGTNNPGTNTLNTTGWGIGDRSRNFLAFMDGSSAVVASEEITVEVWVEMDDGGLTDAPSAA
jgi:hypothetical protein